MEHVPDVLAAARAFGSILDTAGIGLLVQSIGRNFAANTVALRILGVDEDAFLRMEPGSADWRAVLRDGRPLGKEELPGMMALHTMQPVKDMVIGFSEKKEGRRRWISSSAAPVPGADGGETLVYQFIRDISELLLRDEDLNRSREEAQAANFIKDDFLTMLSHEMRTPLNGIMGMLQLALHARSRDSIQEYLTVALESSKHLLLLLGDISEIAGSDAGPLQIKVEPFDLESAVYPTITSFSNRTKTKGLKISCRIDPRLPHRLLGDAGRIRQILFNLLANAVKYADKGEIVISISPLAEHDRLKRHGLHILLGDGESIPAFEQGRDDTEQAGGLGLTIVRRLVRLLGGEVNIAVSKDKKTDVEIFLPLPVGQVSDNDLSSAESREMDLPQAGAAKVLVVEDEPINLKTMLLSLQLLGCKAIGADSAYKGLALLRREKFDIVLMDIQLPGLDGLEATRLIRNDSSGLIDSSIPIVAITAHAMPGDKERILKAGVDEYLAKPVYLEQLRGVLSKILNRPLSPFPR